MHIPVELYTNLPLPPPPPTCSVYLSLSKSSALTVVLSPSTSSIYANSLSNTSGCWWTSMTAKDRVFAVVSCPGRWQLLFIYIHDVYHLITKASYVKALIIDLYITYAVMVPNIKVTTTIMLKYYIIKTAHKVTDIPVYFLN